METKLRWKKGLFSNTYRIYSGERFVGSLNEKTFSKTAWGELNGEKYTFKSKGVFKNVTELFDNNNKVIGQITYNSWMTRANLSVFDKTIIWKYDNVWNTKWKMFDSEGTEIRYSGSSSGGMIETNSDDPLLILSGLFVVNYYWQVSIAVLVAIFIPIIASSSN